MRKNSPPDPLSAAERADWLEAIQDIHRHHGRSGVADVLATLRQWGAAAGVPLPTAVNTPYLNTIPAHEEPPYPGDLDIERRLENIVRWNATALVLRAQDTGLGLGGHIATYASAATMMEVGFNHFFQAPTAEHAGDIVIPQPHAAPGIYARSWLEGALDDTLWRNYRRELNPQGGLTAYPHPRSFPQYWQVANASMGLSTPLSIYQARFAKYLRNRGLKATEPGTVWCFIGDGETDEPEVLGSLNIAAREGLDNLVLVVNCNLQRLDGPVRGNGKIIQELEASFVGAGWHVIKVIWGSGWDKLLADDSGGILRARMEECVDGDYQRYSVLPGDSQREHWVNGKPELRHMMAALSDEELREIKRGGQDAVKVHAAFHQARQVADKPVVILVKTVKGDGIVGTAGSNSAHQKKNLSGDERVAVARNLDIPLSDEAIRRAESYRPDPDSEELRYLRERRAALGGSLPRRATDCKPLEPPPRELFGSLLAGSGERPQSTTMSLVRILSALLRDKKLAKYIVPIIPDEARTFGLEALFKLAGIFSLHGQRYTPVDANTLLAYREAEDGQILQEGICETGAMASFLAAGTAYSIHGRPMIPFYFFYSIFGFQRVGDMIWTCGDMLCRGFLIGGTAGRTTLNGEGLQHQDGHSQLVANTVPCVVSYDPAFAYEMVVIVREGIRRMYAEGENIFYYLTAYNENYPMPAQPADREVESGILRGAYHYTGAEPERAQVHLLGSGSIMQQVLAARETLAAAGFAVAVWSVTSYNELLREAESCERHNRLQPTATPRQPYVQSLFAKADGTVVAVTDYMRSLPGSIARWLPESFTVLGTDGFGLCDSRADLRRYFAVDRDAIVHAALVGLLRRGDLDQATFDRHLRSLTISGGQDDPMSR